VIFYFFHFFSSI